jgi:hypothetical protein
MVEKTEANGAHKRALEETQSALQTVAKQQRPNDCDGGAICFYCTRTERLLQYTSKILEAPYSRACLLATMRGKGGLSWELINGTGKDSHTKRKANLRNDEQSHEEIFSRSQTVVIADSVLIDSAFASTGLRALLNFFQRGGVVVVDCECGDAVVASTLNKLFGTSWSHFAVAEDDPTADDNFLCIPTEAGKGLLRHAASPEIYFGGANMMSVGEEEALYVPRPMSRLEFIVRYLEDNTGMTALAVNGQAADLDHMHDEELVGYYREALHAWKERQAVFRCTPIALYAHAGGGKLVWNGDRGLEDTRMRSVLAELVCNL